MKSVSDVPALVGTLEDPLIPFSSISILRKYNETDMTYKIFTRQPASDSLLDELFRLVTTPPMSDSLLTF